MTVATDATVSGGVEDRECGDELAFGLAVASAAAVFEPRQMTTAAAFGGPAEKRRRRRCLGLGGHSGGGFVRP